MRRPPLVQAPSPLTTPAPATSASAKAPDFELDEGLRSVAARWLNLVPAEHRHESRESAQDALDTLREHARSCPDHPLGALWVAHRHLNDPASAVRIAALVLASEALWWLGHFEDARSAAQAAVDADPASAQALWRLAVALYRLARFEEAAERLDDLVEADNRFAPALALRGQVKIWLDPRNPQAGRPDFAAAAALDSGTWVVPYRMTTGEFRAAVDERSRCTTPRPAAPPASRSSVVLLPETARVERGVDPDRRGIWPARARAAAIRPVSSAASAGTSPPRRAPRVPFGERFVLYQRNIENLCRDKATLREEIRRSVAELFDAALDPRTGIAIKGAPEHHAEAANLPEDEATARADS